MWGVYVPYVPEVTRCGVYMYYMFRGNQVWCVYVLYVLR